MAPELATLPTGQIVSRETLSQITLFLKQLTRWNPTINLVSFRNQDELWERHVGDSLRLVGLMPAGVGRAIDLGSGGGFPGLVLAMATGVRFTLIEADRRKAAFLREAARCSGAPVVVCDARIEAAAVEPAPLVTARALAPLPRLLGLAHRLVAPGGMLLLPKGAGAAAEIEAARAAWRFEVVVHGDAGRAGSVVLGVTELAPR